MDLSELLASNGSGDAALAHVSAGRLALATTLTVDSTANWPTKFIATSGTLLATGYIDPATKLEFKGHLSGGNIIIDSFMPGYTDTGNTQGQVVVLRPSTGLMNELIALLQTSLNNDGTLKTGIVATGMVAALAINNSKLAADISPAKFANPSKFSVYRNAAWTHGGGWVKVPFDTELFDTGSDFDSTTNFRFTAPVSGFYQINANAGYIPVISTDPMLIAIYKNGAELVRGNENPTLNGADSLGHVSELLQLAANDYLEIFSFNASGTNKTGSVSRSFVYFSGFLVSTT